MSASFQGMTARRKRAWDRSPEAASAHQRGAHAAHAARVRMRAVTMLGKGRPPAGVRRAEECQACVHRLLSCVLADQSASLAHFGQIRPEPRLTTSRIEPRRLQRVYEAISVSSRRCLRPAERLTSAARGSDHLFEVGAAERTRQSCLSIGSGTKASNTPAYKIPQPTNATSSVTVGPPI